MSRLVVRVDIIKMCHGSAAGFLIHFSFRKRWCGRENQYFPNTQSGYNKKTRFRVIEMFRVSRKIGQFKQPLTSQAGIHGRSKILKRNFCECFYEKIEMKQRCSGHLQWWISWSCIKVDIKESFIATDPLSRQLLNSHGWDLGKMRITATKIY